MTRSISEKRDENPAYYDSFSKRIKDALALYREKVISEAEYLAKMRTIMEDYYAGKSTVSYPERIKNNVHAQAFYGVLTALFDEVEDERITPDFVAEVSEEITKNRRFPQSGGLDEQQDHPRPHFAGHRRSVLSIRKRARSEALLRSHRQGHRQRQDRCPAEVLSDGHHQPKSGNRRRARNLYSLERKQVKNLNLRVRKDGSVWVSAEPGVPCEEIDAFVADKARIF